MKALRRTLLTYAVPITKAVGKVHAPFAHKRVTGLHARAALKRLVPGHVLMSRTRGELTNLFIPGFWSHGAIYVGDGYVAEAIGDGVTITDVVSFLVSKDDVAICEPTFATGNQMRDAARWARAQRGKPYDYAFGAGGEAFYCFELTYHAYRHACGVESPWQLRTETLGVPTVVGDDIERASDKWLIVFDTRQYAVVRNDGHPILVARRLACTPSR